MKLILSFMLAVFVSAGALAQNTNVTKTSKTTVTTIKDSDGEKKLVRTQNVDQQQKIEFQDAESNALNKDVKATPVQVVSSTQVMLPDGTTRVVDVDRTAYYTMGEHEYKVYLDNKGYAMVGKENQNKAVLRHLSDNSYIYKAGDKISVGHFDQDGNLVLQSYDDKTDEIKVEILKRK